MGIVHVDNLRAGLVLREDVRDVSSRLLLSKGMQIKTEHQRIFKIWGVTEVMVEGDQENGTSLELDVDPEVMERIAERLKQVFQHVDRRHPAMKELYRVSVEYHSRRAAGKKDARVLEAVNKNAATLRPGDMRKEIDLTEIKLPEIPSIIYELNEVIAAPLASAQDIARIVNKSPSIAALLLRVVNSAFYGFPSRIDSITRAVTLI